MEGRGQQADLCELSLARMARIFCDAKKRLNSLEQLKNQIGAMNFKNEAGTRNSPSWIKAPHDSSQRVNRKNKIRPLTKILIFVIVAHITASYPSGKGLVCKTTMHRFDSD